MPLFIILQVSKWSNVVSVTQKTYSYKKKKIKKKDFKGNDENEKC